MDQLLIYFVRSVFALLTVGLGFFGLGLLLGLFPGWPVGLQSAGYGVALCCLAAIAASGMRLISD